MQVRKGVYKVQEGDGARVCVEALYDVRSSRRIGLTFQAAGVSDIVISPLLETLLAPALLPRTFVNQQILLFLKEVREVEPVHVCLLSSNVYVRDQGLGLCLGFRVKVRV